jgi:hypothetical protein
MRWWHVNLLNRAVQLVDIEAMRFLSHRSNTEEVADQMQPDRTPIAAAVDRVPRTAEDYLLLVRPRRNRLSRPNVLGSKQTVQA